MSGDSNKNGGGKALSSILYVWDDNAVNLDDNGGWSFDFSDFVSKESMQQKQFLTLPRLLKFTYEYVLQ